MAAQFKSNVRLREEKGFGSISMKRLIFSGTGAVFLFMGSRMTPFASMSLPILVGCFILLLVLSGSRGGLPLWQRLVLGWRARLLLVASEHPTGAASQIVLALNLNANDTHLRSSDVFQNQKTVLRSKDNRWAIYSDVREVTQDGKSHSTRLLVVDDFGVPVEES
ncbi:MAG: hypothetical protein KC546_08620 [Anaerolineae bacterium]|nr:hypothetical protein [Anaerolineae bacterium]MCA9888424.1 hypothetical protein [Anaerolineae bacterium]MCA9891439.1 hypothetical protein [Anaerolineae bacterium]